MWIVFATLIDLSKSAQSIFVRHTHTHTHTCELGKLGPRTPFIWSHFFISSSKEYVTRIRDELLLHPRSEIHGGEVLLESSGPTGMGSTGVVFSTSDAPSMNAQLASVVKSPFPAHWGS